MKVYLAFSLFSLAIVLYWIVSEVFTVLFRFTGLPDEKARFQVVSLLTGCGFTTRESEMIVISRSRRRLAHITMLFGYVFSITFVSAFINIFLSLNTTQAVNYLLGMFMPMAAIILVFIIMRVPGARAATDRIIENLADRFFNKGSDNTVLLLDTIAQDSIVRVTLNHIPESYENLSLAEMRLGADKGILVMIIEHPGKKAEAAGADTVFRQGDKLTVFGRYNDICKFFQAHEHLMDDDL